MYDYHMHTPLCNHAEETPLFYARAAYEAGLAGICFTEHNPMPPHLDPRTRMRTSDIPVYLELVGQARQAFAGRLEVNIGIEADFVPGTESFVARTLEAHHWDYVIGSVHYVGPWGFHNRPTVSDTDAFFGEYYRLIVLAAGSRLFDAIGHLDLGKRFIAPPKHHMELVLPALDAIAEAGLVLDYNTSGEYKAGGAYPSDEILQAAFERDIQVVMGSDAHKPSEVGHAFAKARGTLQRMGYSEAQVFRKRQRQRYELNLAQSGGHRAES